MQTVEYIRNNGYAILKSSYETVKQFHFSFVTDILEDLGEIIKTENSDPHFREIQIYSHIVRGSIVGLVSSVALIVLGTLIGSNFLVAVGIFGKEVSLVSGFLGFAGQIANQIAESHHITTSKLS